MIVLNCNKRWEHNSKTKRASQILKKVPERYEFAVFCWKISSIFEKKSIFLFCFQLDIKICKVKKMEKIVEMLTQLFFFKLLSFLNGLSYRCQIGLKWKIIWSSFWEKLKNFTYLESWLHFLNWKSILQKSYSEKTVSSMLCMLILLKSLFLVLPP